MIKTKKQLYEWLRYERCQYGISFHNVFLSFFGASEKGIIWKYQKRLRKTEYYFNSRKKIRFAFSKLKLNKIAYKYGISIGINCFDKGLVIRHLGNILVNSDSSIGCNCLIHPGVYIVTTSGITSAPVIGNNVKIGVGAIIIGDIKIADNTIIAAGAVVTQSFLEDGMTIGGIPAKVISSKGLL